MAQEDGDMESCQSYRFAAVASTNGIRSSTRWRHGVLSLAFFKLMNLCHILLTMVTTPDGYILSLQRIPKGRQGGDGSRRQPVLLQHGVLVDGMSWLLNAPDQSLPLILADNGFEVWIANTRGTEFSRRHVSLNTYSKIYWDWTWDDLVAKDFPTIVNYIYAQAGQKLHYIGHSMGTLVPLASFSVKINPSDKIKSVVLLSPVAYLSHMTTPVGVFSAKAFLDEILSGWLGVAEFNPRSSLVSDFVSNLCKFVPGANCYDLLDSITGFNCCLNASTISLFLKYEPQSSSTKNMVHLAQTFRNGALTKFDYGNINTNMEKYEQRTPPVYDLRKIPPGLPFYLSYGGRDMLSDPWDVRRLLADLKHHQPDKLKVQFLPSFAHADFILGVSAKDVVYPEVISFLNHWG